MSMSQKDYDILDLITQAQIGINWLFESTQSKNCDQTFKQVLEEFSKSNENINVFNKGTVLMFAYISLVLPKECIFDQLVCLDISLKDFSILKDTYSQKASARNVNCMIRHIRNALAHGHVETDNDCFKFYDCNSNRGKPKEEFCAQINFYAFGKFISNYYYNLKKQFFKKEF